MVSSFYPLSLGWNTTSCMQQLTLEYDFFHGEKKERIHHGHVNVMGPLCVAQNSRWIASLVFPAFAQQDTSLLAYRLPVQWYPIVPAFWSLLWMLVFFHIIMATSTLKSYGFRLLVYKWCLDGFTTCKLTDTGKWNWIISYNHFAVFIQFPSLRMEADRIRMEMKLDISDNFG